MQNRKRLYYIDNLKGFLIILVVLGHCIQNFMPNYESNILFRFIYSFHMPLFIFVSGYVSYKDHITWKSVDKRFMQLMIPFFAWGVVKALIKWDAGMIPYIIQNPDNGLWFLHTLFFISLIMMICEFIAEKLHVQRYIVVLAAGLLLLGTMYGFGFRDYGFQSVAYYYMYYVAGFYARKTDVYSRVSFTITIIPTVLFLCLVPFWNLNSAPSLLPEISSPMFATFFRIVVALLAIAGVFALFKNKVDINNRLGAFLGGRTLGIYAIHPALINLYKEYSSYSLMGGAFCVLSIVIVLAFTFAIYQLLSKNKYLSKVFLGI